MRVLITTPSVRPLGARRSLVELVRALPGDIEPMVVCPSEEGIYDELQALGVPVAVAPHGAWRKLSGRMVAVWRQIPQLRTIISKFSAQVVHCNEYHIIPQSIAAARPGGLPVTGHVRLSMPPRHVSTYQLAGCRRIICVSNAVRDQFPAELQSQVEVVYNGVDVERVRGGAAAPLPQLAAWRAEGRRVLGLLGLVSERKNQIVAAEAVAKANRRGGKWGIVFAGDAFKSSEGYGNRLRERLAAPDLVDCALWLPFQDETAPIYRGLDINLLISGEEGFGRTIIEAGALGVPSIGARTGGIPELVEDGRCGWLVEAGSADALATLLGEIAQQGSAEIARRGEAMARRVEQHFTIQAHVGRMVAAWQSAALNG